jgi:pyrroline-5-carboxylate reductase
MGGAVARALADGPYFNASDITCTARTRETLLDLGRDFRTTTDNLQAVRAADVVFFAVKPWLMESVIKEVASELDPARQIIVSVAAGVTFSQISEWLGVDDATIFRVIPNTAIEVGTGVTFISSVNASDEQRKMILDAFTQMGFALEVDESMMNAGTHLASCGIAYAMKYIQAAVAGGEMLGFDKEQAEKIVEYTVKGAAELLLSTGNAPQQEIDKVTTPGGMTQKGLAAMEEAGFSQAVLKSLQL